jgi:ABC-2 type transport system permease protein
VKGFFNRISALIRKELYGYIISPASYGIAVFFLLCVSLWLFYFERFFAMDTATLRPFFAAFPPVFVLVIPLITMKSWAEERKLGTIELLLTLPFSDWELVLGKFFSALAMLSLIIGFTIPVPLSLLPLAFFDIGVIIGEYAGVLLLGASATALGLLLSSLSKSQASSFLGSAALLLTVILINQLTLNFDLPLPLAEGINFISLSFHFESFSRGVIDSRDISFFLLSTVLFLFLNTRVLIFRRWSSG